MSSKYQCNSFWFPHSRLYLTFFLSTVICCWHAPVACHLEWMYFIKIFCNHILPSYALLYVAAECWSVILCFFFNNGTFSNRRDSFHIKDALLNQHHKYRKCTGRKKNNSYYHSNIDMLVKGSVGKPTQGQSSSVAPLMVCGAVHVCVHLCVQACVVVLFPTVCAWLQLSPDQTLQMEESTALSLGMPRVQTENKHRRICASCWCDASGSVPAYSHGHFKLVKPLLLQLPGLEKQLKARVALLVSHVEPVAPLRRSCIRTAVKLGHTSGGHLPTVKFHLRTIRVGLDWTNATFLQFKGKVDYI